MTETTKPPEPNDKLSTEAYEDLLDKYQYSTKEISAGEMVKGRVIKVTDLPADAQKKLFSRKGHRQPSALSDLNLLGDQPAGGSPVD